MRAPRAFLRFFAITFIVAASRILFLSALMNKKPKRGDCLLELKALSPKRKNVLVGAERVKHAVELFRRQVGAPSVHDAAD